MITIGNFSQEDPLIKRLLNRGLIGRDGFDKNTIVSSEIIKSLIHTYEHLSVGDPYTLGRVSEVIEDLRVLLTYISKKEIENEQESFRSRWLRHCC